MLDDASSRVSRRPPSDQGSESPRRVSCQMEDPTVNRDPLPCLVDFRRDEPRTWGHHRCLARSVEALDRSQIILSHPAQTT